MKKFVVLIIILLPIFLMVSISIAGRIFTLFSPVRVESVDFVDEDGKIITDGEISTEAGEVFELTVRVLPEKATNKKVTYFLETDINNPVCGLGPDGRVEALVPGVAYVSVETEDQRKTAEIRIRVTPQYSVTGITISKDEITLKERESYILVATVLPSTALDKNVTWSSSHPDTVSVRADGRIEVLKKDIDGEEDCVIITATAADGGYQASCKVYINEGKAAVAFKKPEIGEVWVLNEKTVDLADYIEYDEELVNFGDIIFSIIAGGSHSALENGIFTAGRTNFTYGIEAKINVGGEEITAEIRFRFV